ncbi:hypothetical protein PIB30_045622 [Stylosanthes scabra]|uniref:Uncharacterized protein n=1 Tax=Stylosanthes scabra TaxID=79078 RepID=A0ABU6UGF4_9FABA|nr:hypothetical protein [Stylosanthes scabra]
MGCEKWLMIGLALLSISSMRVMMSRVIYNNDEYEYDVELIIMAPSRPRVRHTIPRFPPSSPSRKFNSNYRQLPPHKSKIIEPPPSSSWSPPPHPHDLLLRHTTTTTVPPSSPSCKFNYHQLPRHPPHRCS